MQSAANPTASKKAANLSINADLLNQAKALHINLSATLERALAEAIRDKQREQWLQENQQSIEDYNQRIEAEGCFSDSLHCTATPTGKPRADILFSSPSRTIFSMR